MAIAAMVLGILGLVFCWVPVLGALLALVALILGIVCLAKREPKRGFALTGLITGAVGVVAGLIVGLAVGGAALFVSERNDAEERLMAEMAAEQAELAERAAQERRPAEADALEAQRRAEEAALAAQKLSGTLAEQEAILKARELQAQAEAARKSASKKGGGISDDPLGGIDL